MAEPLLQTRRFLPLFVSQTLGALNDNLFKNALVVLAVLSASDGAPALVALAGAVFIAPYGLFSALAGQLADQRGKAGMVRATKALEVVLMLGAAVGFLFGSVPVLLAVLFGLGTQATFFSPLKYGLLPELLHENELVGGNALVEAGTFGGILAGTIAGGALIALDNGAAIVSAAGLAVAVAGLAAAWAVPAVPPASPGLRVGWNIVAETAGLLRLARGNPVVWPCIMALSWFWTVGATFLAEFPVLARTVFGADSAVMTLLLAGFAVGVGAGSMLAGRLLRGEVSARHVPAAVLFLSAFTWGFAMLAGSDAARGWHTPADMLTNPAGVAALLCLLGAAASGGVFSVPLYAMIQERSDPAFRARMIAANNVVNAAFMVAGAVVIAGLAAAGVRPPTILGITAALNLLAFVYVLRFVPPSTVRAVFQGYFRLFHRASVSGLEHVPPPGQRVVVVCNHTSLADGCLLAAFLPEGTTFVVDTFMARKWWVRPFLTPVPALMVDPTNPYAARDMVRAVQAGTRLVIFPEGRITKTGGLMKVYDGAGMVADRADALVLPVRIDGLERSRFSRMKGKARLSLFPHVSLVVRPAVRLEAGPDMAGRARRQALAASLHDLMAGSQFATRRIDRSLFAALLDAAATHGASTEVIEDVAFQPLTYRKLLLGASVLGRALQDVTEPGEVVGVMLPNASGAVVTFFALHAFGRVPAMLNFSAGPDAMLAACAAARVRTVLCSRVFVEKGKLGKTVARMEGAVRFVWLDDVRANISTRAKLRGLLDARRAHRLPGASTRADGPAAVLFTSGSEGAPKGVVLSHRNILANIAQVASVLDFSPADRVLNAMPMFHSIGLSSATLLPLLSGARTFLYPSPLHYRMVPELIYGTDATITFGSDTFLQGWARYAHPYDYRTMRYVVAGAEKVKDETRRTYADKFAARILEGYGATETAPVLALSTPMSSRPGTVGRLLPGIEWRLQPVPGIEQGGVLQVRGPNVMLGYVRTTAPGVLEPPPDGWYDTGDIVDVDARGFVTILGRAKRFAKIGGEMVSMPAAEALATAVWPGAQHAVLAVPDARKGEALVLLTTQDGANGRRLVQEARAPRRAGAASAAHGARRAVGAAAGVGQDGLPGGAAVAGGVARAGAGGGGGVMASMRPA